MLAQRLNEARAAVGDAAAQRRKLLEALRTLRGVFDRDEARRRLEYLSDQGLIDRLPTTCVQSDRLEVTAHMRRLRTQISAALKVLEREKRLQAAKDREAKRKADLAERAEKARLAEIARAERLRPVRVGRARKSLGTAAVEFNAAYSAWRRPKPISQMGASGSRQRLAISKVSGDCQLRLTHATDYEHRYRTTGKLYLESTVTLSGTVDFRENNWRVDGSRHSTLIKLIFTPCSDATCDSKKWPFTRRTEQTRGQRTMVHKEPMFLLLVESKLHADRLSRALRTLIKDCPNKR